MPDVKCPECGQTVADDSKTAVLNAINTWSKKPWDVLIGHEPGYTFRTSVGDVMLVAVCDPKKFNNDDGYGFQGTEPECWVVVFVNGRLFRKQGKTDSYTRVYDWSGDFVEVIGATEEKASWVKR